MMASGVAGEPEREALARIVHSGFSGLLPDRFDDEDLEIADAILAAGYRREPEPRTVTTIEELDALPELSAVLSEQGAIWQAYGNGDFREYLEIGDNRYSGADDIALPATVLFSPSGEESK